MLSEDCYLAWREEMLQLCAALGGSDFAKFFMNCRVIQCLLNGLWGNTKLSSGAMDGYFTK